LALHDPGCAVTIFADAPPFWLMNMDNDTAERLATDNMLENDLLFFLNYYGNACST